MIFMSRASQFLLLRVNLLTPISSFNGLTIFIKYYHTPPRDIIYWYLMDETFTTIMIL